MTIMRDRLSAEAGVPVELEHTTFIPTGERAAGIALRRVKEHQPDVVVVPVAAYVFNAPFVWLRVQRIFGKRAGHWFRNIEQVVDSSTYEKGGLRSNPTERGSGGHRRRYHNHARRE